MLRENLVETLRSNIPLLMVYILMLTHAAQQPLAHDPALRASADWRLRFMWSWSQRWFQVEVRAGRMKRTLD